MSRLLLLCCLLAACAPDRPTDPDVAADDDDAAAADDDAAPDVTSNVIEQTGLDASGTMYGWLAKTTLTRDVDDGSLRQTVLVEFVITDTPDWCAAEQSYWDGLVLDHAETYYASLQAFAAGEPRSCEDWVTAHKALAAELEAAQPDGALRLDLNWPTTQVEETEALYRAVVGQPEAGQASAPDLTGTLSGINGTVKDLLAGIDCSNDNWVFQTATRDYVLGGLDAGTAVVAELEDDRWSLELTGGLVGGGSVELSGEFEPCAIDRGHVPLP